MWGVRARVHVAHPGIYILANIESLHLHADVEAVLDDLVAHVRPRLVLVGGHELARVQVHVQADEPVAQLEARHERVRREEAGRRIVCSMHVSSVFPDSGAVESTQLQHSVSRKSQAEGQVPVSRSRAWRQAGDSEIEDPSGRPRKHGAGLAC